MPENFYEILNCTQTATYEEIKKNYQQLVKEHHPDKQSTDVRDFYLKIDEAWKTLRDEESRRKYDATLALSKSEEQYLVYAKLNVNELDFDNNLIHYYPCRCGSMYVIDKNLITEDCVIECEECSFTIELENK